MYSKKQTTLAESTLFLTDEADIYAEAAKMISEDSDQVTKDTEKNKENFSRRGFQDQRAKDHAVRRYERIGNYANAAADRAEKDGHFKGHQASKGEVEHLRHIARKAHEVSNHAKNSKIDPHNGYSRSHIKDGEHFE